MPASTKRVPGKGVTVTDKPAPPPIVVPDFAKVDVGNVLARLLAAPDEYAKQAYDEARKSFYKNVLEGFPDVGKGIAAHEAPMFAAELQRVADAAGVKKEDLDRKVEERRKVLIEKKVATEATLSHAHEDAKKAVKESGKGFLEELASVRVRIDDEGERRAAAVRGGGVRGVGHGGWCVGGDAVCS